MPKSVDPRHRFVSFYERQAQRAAHANRVRALIATAPTHPAGPESRLRLIAARIVAAINHELRVRFLERAQRHDAPRPRTVARRELRQAITPIAQDLARETHARVARSLGVAPSDLEVDLSEQSYGFVDNVVRTLEDYPIEATKRVAQAFKDWEGVAPEERNKEALHVLIDSALRGGEGKLQNSLRITYGDAFAQMNKAVQVQAGVTGYWWKDRGDGRVRPAHAACTNVGSDDPYDWDDPPLKADVSSNHADCHPGEDYNCRCVAIPVPAEDQ